MTRIGPTKKKTDEKKPGAGGLGVGAPVRKLRFDAAHAQISKPPYHIFRKDRPGGPSDTGH